MILTDITSYNSHTPHILREDWEYLTERQRIFLDKSERELWPLLEQLINLFEAELTPAQIHAVFQNAEQISMAGNNKTALGTVAKGAAAVGSQSANVLKKINDKVNELGKLAQRSGPVRNADAQFERLKKDITRKSPQLAQHLSVVGDWMKANPKKASLGIAILTAAAAFASGPAGGAALGFLLRATKQLLQGEQLSTATGKATKAAGIGALAGIAFDVIGDDVVDNIANASADDIDSLAKSFETANVDQALAEINPEYSKLLDEIADYQTIEMSGNVNNFRYNYDITLSPEQLQQFNQYDQQLTSIKSFSDEWYQKTAEFHNWMSEIQNNPLQATYQQAIAALSAAQESDTLTSDQLAQLVANIEGVEQKIQALAAADAGIAAAVQAAAQQADTVKEKSIQTGPPRPPANETISMDQQFESWLLEHSTNNALLMDAEPSLGARVKQGASAAAGKAGSAIKQTGKELSNKVTAKKLEKMWKSAGSPSDKGSIINILSSAGISDDQIGQISKGTKTSLVSAPRKSRAKKPPVADPAAPDSAAPTPRPSPASKPPSADPQIASLVKSIQRAGVADAVKQLLTASIQVDKLATAIKKAGAADATKQLLRSS